MDAQYAILEKPSVVCYPGGALVQSLMFGSSTSQTCGKNRPKEETQSNACYNQRVLTEATNWRVG